MVAVVMGKRGPKPKIGPEQERQIYAILTAGCSLNDAADVLGIARNTILNHKAESAKFCTGVDRAAAKGKLRLVKKVGKAKPWQAAAWMLERKYGAEFGKKDTLDHQGTIRLLPMKLDGDRTPVNALPAPGTNGNGNGHPHRAAGDADALPEAGGSDPLPGSLHGD